MDFYLNVGTNLVKNSADIKLALRVYANLKIFSSRLADLFKRLEDDVVAHVQTAFHASTVAGISVEG